MTITQEILTVGAVVLGTMTTRFLPFIIFQLINLFQNIFNIR